MDLSGPWRAAPLNAELSRSGADPDLDDSGWATVEVPGHWAAEPEFANEPGPILYRRSFSGPEPVEGTRDWLRLEGVLDSADVWLDGGYVGHTTGYFVPHMFEITDHLRARTEHQLAVEVSCAPSASDRAKSSLTGSLQAGTLAPPGHPGGIWRPAHIDRTGPVAIRYSRLLCDRVSNAKASLKVRVVLDAITATEVRIDTSVSGPDGTAAAGKTETHALAKGENRIEWNLAIEGPLLWWPAALGSQPLYDVAVAVRSPGDDVSDRRHWRTGLRRIDITNMIWRVNDERLFVKGASLGPQTSQMATMDTSVISQDVRAAREAGLDLIRIHGHVARPEMYAEADTQGLLIWQDLPLVGGYTMNTRKPARSVARSAVDLLGHHPSVALWCAHDEPNGPPLPNPGTNFSDASPMIRSLGRHLMPSWNRSVLDPLLKREIRASDPTRPVLARSGTLPLITDTSTTDSHLWLGWHAGSYEDLPDVLRQWPKLASFLGGFGSQSVAIAEWDESEPSWPTAQVSSFARYLPRRAYPDGIAWAVATQAYQADLLRSHIETIRRLKNRPAGGFCLTSLADAHPEGGFGILNLNREAKPAYHAVVDACRPVIVVADSPDTLTTPGHVMSLDVHAISDLRIQLGEVRVKAVASCADWSHTQEWAGTLEANTCVRVGTLKFRVPKRNGQLIIDLQLVSAKQAATNRYRTVVIPPAEATSRRTQRPSSQKFD